MIINVRTVNSLVAAGTPARALIQTAIMVFAAALDGVGIDLTLTGLRGFQVAAQAEVGVAGDQHLLIYRAMGAMAGNAAFLDRAVFEDKRALLGDMAFGAGLVHALERQPFTLDGVALMDVVAVDAAHVAVEDRVSVGEAELAAFVDVALEAGLGRLLGIDDITATAAGGGVEAAGTVAGFATGGAQLGIGEGDLGVAGRLEVVGLVGMTLGALFVADIGGAGDIRGGEDGAIHADATDQEHAPQGDRSEDN